MEKEEDIQFHLLEGPRVKNYVPKWQNSLDIQLRSRSEFDCEEAV